MYVCGSIITYRAYTALHRVWFWLRLLLIIGTGQAPALLWVSHMTGLESLVPVSLALIVAPGYLLLYLLADCQLIRGSLLNASHGFG